jgi:hypothetical protein
MKTREFAKKLIQSSSVHWDETKLDALLREVKTSQESLSGTVSALASGRFFPAQRVDQEFINDFRMIAYLHKKEGAQDEFKQALQTMDRKESAKSLTADHDFTCILSAFLSWYPQYLGCFANLRDRLTLIDPVTSLSEGLFAIQFASPESREKDLKLVFETLRKIVSHFEQPEKFHISGFRYFFSFLNQSEIDLTLKETRDTATLLFSQQNFDDYGKCLKYNLICAADLAVILIELLKYVNVQEQTMITAQLRSMTEAVMNGLKCPPVREVTEDDFVDLQPQQDTSASSLTLRFSHFLKDAFQVLVLAMDEVFHKVLPECRHELMQVLKWAHPFSDPNAELSMEMTLAFASMRHAKLEVNDEEFKPWHDSIEKPRDWTSNVVMSVDSATAFGTLMESISPNWRNLNELVKLIKEHQKRRDQCDSIVTQLTQYSETYIGNRDCVYIKNFNLLIEFMMRQLIDNTSPELRDKACTVMCGFPRVQTLNCGFLLNRVSQESQRAEMIRELLQHSGFPCYYDPHDFLQGVHADKAILDREKRVLFEQDQLVETLRQMQTIPEGIIRIAAGYVG